MPTRRDLMGEAPLFLHGERASQSFAWQLQLGLQVRAPIREAECIEHKLRGIQDWSDWRKQLDDGWPESEKDVFQAALSMVVVKNSRWMVGEFYMSYGGVSCEK